MTQRAVRPQEQSLCTTVHARQRQCSHQIHFRWFTSREKSATIQMRISVRDTMATVSAPPRGRQWAGRPNLAGRESYGYGAARSSEESPRPGVCPLPPGATPAAGAAGEEADQPDQRQHRGDDEQPVDDKAHAERDDRENRQCNEKQHEMCSPPFVRPLGRVDSGDKRRSGRAGYAASCESTRIVSPFGACESPLNL